MVVEKEKLKKKLKKDFENEIKHGCSICRRTITLMDIEDENFEWVKNKLGENYAHSSCVNCFRKVGSDAEYI